MSLTVLSAPLWIAVGAVRNLNHTPRPAYRLKANKTSRRMSEDAASERALRHSDSVEEKQQMSPLPSPSRPLRSASWRGVNGAPHSPYAQSTARGTKAKETSASSSPVAEDPFDWPTTVSSSHPTPFASRPVTAAPSLQTSRKQSQLARPATALHTKPYQSCNTPSHRDILRSTTTRRAYTASPHRIPFLPTTPPSPLPSRPFQPPAPASFASSTRGPNFFLSSEQNKSDDFLAWMKAMSGNYSTTNGSVDDSHSRARSSRHSHAPLISRQYAFNSQNHRSELVLNDQIRALTSPAAASSLLSGQATVSSTAFLPPSSSLSSRGGYISHAPSARFQMPVSHGQSLATSFSPNYYQYAAFVPVCERGPAYTFGTGRSGDDELEVRRKRFVEEKTMQKEKERSRRRKQRERREAELNGEEKAQEWSEEDEDGQPPIDHIRHNITVTAADNSAASRLQRQSMLSREKQQRQQDAESARQTLQAERDERQQLMLLRHDPAWRAQRRQRQEEAEKARILQRSWLLLITVASRVEVWRQSVEHYQHVMQRERAIKVIVEWLRRCRERKRKQRFLHARRVIRLFWEERLAVQYLHDNEAEKRRAMSVVLTFLSWATSKRKQEVVRAFGTIERKVRVIQRAWREYITVQKWRLIVQALQFVQFNQHPDLYDREKERAEDAHTADRQHSTFSPSSTVSTRPNSASSSQPNPRPSSRSTNRSSTPATTTSHIPRQRIRYFRFLPPTFKSTSPSILPETSHLGTGGLQRWNLMIRMQRELFYERLSEEVRLHFQRSQRRKIEEARDDLNRLGSPRAGGSGLISPRHRMLQPTVCSVEWPQQQQQQQGRDGTASGGGQLRHWLLTNLQLHEMHRRALKSCAVVTLGSGFAVERLYALERTVKYVRRRPADQRDDGSDDRRANSRAEHGVTTWATVKRWQTSPIMEEVDEDEVERRTQEEEIQKSKEKANSIVGLAADGDLSTLARFQLQLKLSAADDGSIDNSD